MKRTLFKAGLCAAAASALFFNEKKWENRLLKERADFDIQKEILLNKINQLENRDTSFRFYEHFANGADYKTIKAIEQRTFVRPQNNIYAQYRPKALSAEVIENNYATMAKICTTPTLNLGADRHWKPFRPATAFRIFWKTAAALCKRRLT